MDINDVDDVDDNAEKMRRRLEDLGDRVDGVEFEHMPPGDRMRSHALRGLQNCGFTEGQAQGILSAISDMLSAEAAEQLHERLQSRRWRNDEDEGCEDEARAPFKTAQAAAQTNQAQPQGVWQHPGLADLLPMLPSFLSALPDLLQLLLRKREEPPRPWWQRQLRKLVGV